MPIVHFTKLYASDLGGLVFHREHKNGKDKILKVDGTRYRDWLFLIMKDNPHPDFKEIQEAEALDNLAALKD